MNARITIATHAVLLISFVTSNMQWTELIKKPHGLITISIKAKFTKNLLTNGISSKLLMKCSYNYGDSLTQPTKSHYTTT